MDHSDRDKLKVLLDYWMRHNSEHSEEFRGWAQKAGAAGETQVQSDIMQAVEKIEKANASLARAMERLRRRS